MQEYLKNSKRIVIKVGSSLLVDEEKGRIHQTWLTTFCSDLADWVREGKEIILVSSGAVAIGRQYFSDQKKKLTLAEKRAAAAAGQIRLAHAYHDILAHQDINIAQVLLTLEDTEDRQRYLNARHTLENLLSYHLMPIINENDTVACAGRRYGDNDRLAARVAQMVSADLLILLSDIDGLYTADPNKNAQAVFIPEVSELNTDIENMAGDSASHCGSGGMRTKILAAKIVMASGCKMTIVNGRVLHPLKKWIENGRSTWFLPKLNPKNARKNWLAQHLNPKGFLHLDAGAVEALLLGNKSLLPAGIASMSGDFVAGDLVCVLDTVGKEFARGLVNYSAVELQKIKGLRSEQIEGCLGYPGPVELIHRDNLVIL